LEIRRFFDRFSQAWTTWYRLSSIAGPDFAQAILVQKRGFGAKKNHSKIGLVRDT
jgi:hypothetical protein